MKADEKIKYIFVFENKGKEVGTTMPHPHGQIYGYSKMPLRLRLELENTKNYYEKTGKNLFDQMYTDEKNVAKEWFLKTNILRYTSHFFANIHSVHTL